MQCSICSEGSKLTQCQCCQSQFICEHCQTEGYQYFEWWDIMPKCDQCAHVICRDCTIFCHDCASNFWGQDGETYETLCLDCEPEDFTNICDEHDRIVCSKHPDKSCGECRANRNYDLRHQ